MPSLRILRARVPRRASAGLTAIAVVATLATPFAAHADSSAAASAAAHSSASASAASLTALQASAQARKTGKAVPVPSATTGTATLTAEPNGSMVLTETPIPVRKKIDGTWKSLDATLVKNADGSISPALSTDSLRLSGGGIGALATMSAGPDSISITLPAQLPAPNLSGASATYANVAPGVDLVVTANTQGGFSDVFVVHNATAAASTALAALLKETVNSTGLNVTEGHGAVAATGRTGKAVFASNSPTLWDSNTTAQGASATSPATARAQAASSAAAPGSRAHVGLLSPTLSGKTLTLSPDQNVLHGSKSVYPVYIDPYWNPTENGWSTVAEEYPTTLHWDSTPESLGYMSVGYGESDYSLWARSMVNFSIPTATLAGSTITGAVFSAMNEYSGACPDGGTDEQLNVDAPSQTLNSSNAMWNDWNTSGDVGPQIGYKSFAYGYSTTVCSSGGSPNSASVSLLTGTFSSDVSSGKSTQTLALVAANETSENGWKEFIASTSQLTLTYDFPAQITSETTNSKGCGTASNPSLLGVGDVDLVAGVYQKDGSSLTANFRLYNAAKTTEYNPTSTTGATTSSASAVATTSGAKVPLTVKSTFFTGLGITAQTTFAWTVQATDGTIPGTSSTVTCYFTYDPTTPGEPTLDDAGGQTKCINSAASYQVGTQASFIVDYNTSGSTPASYLYQLNAAAPISIPATSGDATITLKPTQGSNILTVTAVNASGNIGDPARCDFSAKAATPAGDGDMTGDGVPDLLTTGTGTGMPAGLWLANGTTTGAIASTPRDIGVNGAGLVGTAADYSGGQAITGQFTENGFNDALVYYPVGTILNGTTQALTAAQGMIITGTGDGTDLQAQDSQNTNPISYAALTDNSSLYPTQIANAYHADSNDNSNYPDLIGIAGNSSGYYLDYYPSSTGIGSYASLQGSNALTISMKTPDSTADWNAWTIATTYVGSQVDMYLWNAATGALYLWTGITVVDGNNTTNTGTLSYTNSYEIREGSTSGTVTGTTATTWNKGASFHTLQAADINGDGTPDLWTVTAGGTVTATIVTGLSTTADATTLTAGTAQQLNTATHNWALNDYTGTGTSSGGTAGDNTSGTALNLTGTGSPYTHAGDQFTPDVAFPGTTGSLATGSNAIDLTGSFTVSAWVKPGTAGCMAMSQDGSAYPGMYVATSGSTWALYLAKDNASAGWNGDAITGGAVQPESWAHLQATYNNTTKVMSLYVDDTLVAYGNHTAPSSGNGATGAFRLGSNIDGGKQTNYCTGQIAQVQTWNGAALAPNQPYTPASYHQAITPERILDTRNTTGDNLTSGTTSASTPVAAHSTTTLEIVGDTVAPIVSGAPTTIPATATAVAADVTLVSETAAGELDTYADGTQRPITSSNNYYANTTVTGYQVIPIGIDGKIALYNASSGTTHLIVDITGYFTSDATRTGDQTYTPLTTAYRALNTAASTANTSLTKTGPVASNSSFTLQITGVDGIPSTATAVAINLAAFTESGGGILEAYETGTTAPTDTTLTYQGGSIASLAADVTLGTGGKITINNVGGSTTDIIGDIAGYFTNTTSGEVYHATAPTRLVDTRTGVGGTTGPIAANGTYTISQNTIGEVTTATKPTLALMLTVTNTADAGDMVAYPGGTTVPGASNLNWSANQTISNLALVTTGNTGTIAVYNQNAATADLVVDSSGYFASY